MESKSISTSISSVGSVKVGKNRMFSSLTEPEVLLRLLTAWTQPCLDDLLSSFLTISKSPRLHARHMGSPEGAERERQTKRTVLMFFCFCFFYVTRSFHQENPILMNTQNFIESMSSKALELL